MVRVWPGFLAAQLLGILLAPVAGSWIPIANLSIGIGVAVSAALLPRHGRFEAIVVSMVVGLSVITVSLEGHRLFELPLFIHAGILFAANAVTAFSAGLSRLAMEKVKMLWMRVVWRIAASWIAAVLMLYLAFTVSVGSQG